MPSCQRCLCSHDSIPLIQALQWAREAVDEQASRQGIAIKIDAPPHSVQIDVPKLQQLLVILLRCLLNYDVSINWIQLTAVVDEQQIRVDVTAERPLLSQENLVRVFADFCANQQRRSQLCNSNGLNLAIATLIARVLGGELSVTSGLDGFRLKLPRETHPSVLLTIA